MPLVSRTRATLRRAEFGFFGVAVYTRVHTPRRWGAAMRRLRPWPDFKPGVVVFFCGRVRPFLISWLVVGTANEYSCPALGYAGTVEQERPLLALDVDGVISLFGFQRPMTEAPGRFHLIDGMAHCIPEGIGERLARVADHYEIVWATGWEDRANDRLPEILGLPGELPFLTFDGNARFGSAHWKLGPLEEHCRGRALAWLDDNLDESCYEWAERRSEPTLLVPTESPVGLTDAHVEAMEAWAREGFEPA